MENTRVKISVILPVYNVEKYLLRCLDSLVKQTFDSYEIIAVDDGSTDGSGKILDDYKERYPTLFRVLHTQNQGQGKARNTAAAVSEGEYLTFCDGDDYFEADGLKIMMEELEKNACDLLYCASYRIRSGHRYVLGQLHSPVSRQSMLLEATPFTFWSLLLKRELMQKAGEIPGIIYEDVAYIPNLMRLAENPGYCRKPVYNWVDREDSTVNGTRDKKILDFIKAVKISLENTESPGRDETLMNLADKVVEKIRTAWYFGDVFLDYLLTLKPEIERNSIYLQKAEKYKILSRYLEMAETPYFEKVVYVNGFGGEIDPDYLKEIQKSAFREDTKVEILNEKSCDIEECGAVLSAYQDGKYELAGMYFGMKAIYEKGGIYLGKGMRVTGPFDCLRFYEAFFGYQNEWELTGKVFGGKKQSSVLKEIIESVKTCNKYVGKCSWEFIQDTLIRTRQIEINGCTSFTKYEMALLAPQALMLATGGRGLSLTECTEFEDGQEIRKISLKTASSFLNYGAPWQTSQINNWKYKYEELKYRDELKIRRKEEQIEKLKDKNAALRESGEYKCGSFLRKSKWGKLIYHLISRKWKQS